MCNCVLPDSYDYQCGEFGCLDFEIGYNDQNHWKGINVKLLHPSLIITAKGCWDSVNEYYVPENSITVSSDARWIMDKWDARKYAARQSARPAHGETDGTVRFNSHGYVNVNR